jgi:hypothetical protein
LPQNHENFGNPTALIWKWVFGQDATWCQFRFFLETRLWSTGVSRSDDEGNGNGNGNDKDSPASEGNIE